MKVRDMMTKDVSYLDSKNSVRDAANQMRNLNIGSMPVCENNKPIGIITDRDIVLRSVSEGMSYDDAINGVMTPNVVSVSPDTDVHEAARIMAQHQIRRLPVVENNQIVGMVAIGDFAVRDIYVNEAGSALSSISEPSQPLK